MQTRTVHMAMARPAVVFLGDSRSRWTVMHLIDSVCNSSLAKLYEWGAPHAVSSDRALDVAMDGTANWRSGGGYLCSNDAALHAVSYHLHYGVASVGPYQRNPNTWHHAKDFDDPTLSSTAMSLAALDRLILRLAVGKNATRRTRPLIVLYSSLLWDIERLRTIDARFASVKANRSAGTLRGASKRPRGSAARNGTSGHGGSGPLLPEAWASELSPWLAEYEANFSAVGSSLLRRLRTRRGSHHPVHPQQQQQQHADRLVLVGDFGCGEGKRGGPEYGRVCNHVAPLAAERVRRVAARLGLAFVDLHARVAAGRERINECIKKEYNYQMHPNLHGACVTWDAIARVEPRLPAARNISACAATRFR